VADVTAGWYPDPTGRFEHRYWDGSTWTGYAARDGVQAEDPVPGGPSVDPPAAMPSPAGLGAPAADSLSRPSRNTKVKVLWLAGVPALVVVFFIVADLMPPADYYGGVVAKFLLWTLGLIALVGLVAFIVVAVTTRRLGHALTRGLAWIALSVVTILMIPGTAPIALVAVAKWFPVTFSDPFLYHRPNLKSTVEQYFEVWSWIGRLFGFHTNYGLATQDA
jgi:hypothetical protein